MTASAPEIGLYLNGAWVNVGDRSTYGAYTRDPITITRGRANWSGQVDPARANFTLDSRSHNWAPDDVRSTFWRTYRRNIPCRIGVPAGATYLEGPGVAGKTVASTPNTGVLSFATAHDVRIEFQLDADPTDYTVTGQQYLLADKATPAGLDGWYWTLYNVAGQLVIAWVWYDAGGVQHSVTTQATGGTVPYWVAYRHCALRTTWDPATGTATFYTSDTIGGTWTQIGAPVVQGATSLRTTTGQVCVGGDSVEAFGDLAIRGKVYAFELRNGIGGTVVANPVFAGQTSGASSFADAAGRTWTMGAGGRITNVRWRFHGELASLPVRSNLKGDDIWAPVEAGGILRRLRQGQPVLESALRRAMTRKAVSLINYWPCEETGKTLTAFGAAVGGVPMTITGGYPTTATNTDFACSSALPTPGATAWTATPDWVVSNNFQVRWLMSVPNGFTNAGTNILDLGTTGTHAWYIQYRDTGGGQLRIIGALNSTGATAYDSGFIAFNITGHPVRCTFGVTQNAGNIDIQLYTTDTSGTTGGVSTAAAVAGTLGSVNVIRINSGAAMTSTAFGHVSLQAAVTPQTELLTELQAYSGELAATRFARLCNEEGLAYRIVGDPTRSEAMGPQTPATLMDLLQACADTDIGILGESRDYLGLWFRLRDDQVGQTTGLTLNYTAGEVAGVIELDRDDQGFVNDWTVKGPTGATGRAELNDGSRVSTSQPPVGAGRYAASDDVNALEARLPHLARTRLRFTAVDEPRVTKLATALHLPAISGSLAQTGAVMDLQLGDLVTVTNVGNYTGSLVQIVQGFREVIGDTTHVVELLTTSGRPWGTGYLEGTVLPARFDTGGSNLAAAAIAGATSLLVSSTASPLWTTVGADFPFDVDIDGVRVTVTNIVGATSPQTFTVSPVSRALALNAKVQLADPTYWEL